MGGPRTVGAYLGAAGCACSEGAYLEEAEAEEVAEE